LLLRLQAFCTAHDFHLETALEVVVDGKLVDSMMRDFLKWLGALAKDNMPAHIKDGDERFITPEKFDQASKWLWHTANEQLERIGVSTLRKGYCYDLAGVKAAKAMVADRHQVCALKDCDESTQRADLLISFEQMTAMAHGVLSTDQQINLEPLQVLQIGFAFRGSHAMANRGENFRDLKLSHLYVSQYDELLGGGTLGLVMKNLQGKTQSEKLMPQYTACLAHRNPLLCPIGLLGLSLLYRFTALGESFPRVEDPSSYHHLHVLRATRVADGGRIEAISDNALLATCKALFAYGNVETITNDAYTHQGRHQSAVEAAKAAVPSDDSKKARNYERGAS